MFAVVHLPVPFANPLVRAARRHDTERFDVDEQCRNRHLVFVTGTAQRGEMVEGSAAEADIERPVEVGAVSTIHLPPPPVAVGSQPEVGFVKIAEQQELPDLPQRRQPHHILDSLPADHPGGGPCLIFPAQGQLL